jgi:hypothetical protein
MVNLLDMPPAAVRIDRRIGELENERWAAPNLQRRRAIRDKINVLKDFQIKVILEAQAK